MAKFSMPFNLQKWIDEHREQLKPPVCNKQIFQQDDYIVMVVGGPNNRSDYHYNETPELFYQLEGEMVLSVVNEDVDNEAGSSQTPKYCTLRNALKIALVSLSNKNGHKVNKTHCFGFVSDVTLSYTLKNSA